MFDIGGPELLLILVIALVVLGPRRLPALGRQLGRALTTVRRASREMRTSLEREVALEEVRQGALTVKDTVERKPDDPRSEPASPETPPARGDAGASPAGPAKDGEKPEAEEVTSAPGRKGRSATR